MLAVQESFNSLKASRVRSGLTMALIAIGLMSLVGVLTAIDAIQASVSVNLSQLGGSSFDLTDPIVSRRHSWLVEPAKRPIDYKQVSEFKHAYVFPDKVTVSLTTAFGLQATGNKRKTNPNTFIVGADANYLASYAYQLDQGRNFSSSEIKQARPVVIIGPEIKDALFPQTNAINKRIVVAGKELSIIGVLKKVSGIMGSSSGSRALIVPLNQARLFQKSSGGYKIRITAESEDIATAQALAERTLGNIRGDNPRRKHSFNVEKNESAISSVNKIGDSLRVGGAVIGFITLLGASIGLLNIMIVSVRERTREIGVRKSLGASTNAIRIQFLVEAIVICLFGAVLGIFLGVIVGNLIPLATGAGVFVLPINWMLLGLVTSILVGLLSGYYPANTAAKVDPVESLRYE
jgi:putative ABC transport system permease protein